MRDPATGEFGPGRLSTLDDCEYQTMIGRISRGLFYYELKQVLPSNVMIKVARYTSFDKLEPFLPRMQTSRVGLQFAYHFMYSSEADCTDSVWLYEFQRSEYVMALTGTLCGATSREPAAGQEAATSPQS
jgi:hypothetical protein